MSGYPDDALAEALADAQRTLAAGLDPRTARDMMRARHALAFLEALTPCHRDEATRAHLADEAAAMRRVVDAPSPAIEDLRAGTRRVLAVVNAAFGERAEA